MAVGHKWVDTIGQADAWSLKARRRAGEIVEANEAYPVNKPLRGKFGSLAGSEKKGPGPRAAVREELGISEHESTSWQALARIPKPVFDKIL